MEEQVERKEAAGAAAKEPVKTEGLVPSPDTSERSESASSPPPNCSICLGKLKNTSFTDSCLHQFCFTCLLQWSKIKTECPLCKQTFKSIIHNVRSEEDYDQYHVPRDLASQLPSSQIAASLDVGFELVGGIADVGIQRFVYRTTMTPNRRYNMLLNPEQVARREQIPNMLPPSVSREERRYRRFNPSTYRRNVYQLGEWSNLMPDVYGRFRECSAEYYRRHPNQLTRLVPWINRELQTLLNANEPYIAYVLGVVTDALVRWDIRSAEFRNTMRPYFASYTDHFAHELLNYARSSFDLVGYDQYVTYPTHGRGFGNEYIGRVISPISSVSSTSSDDSDIRVLDQTIDVGRVDAETPSVGPHVIDMPGPSTVAEAFQVPQMGSGRPDVLTISSSCSSSEECEVVGYVKPRHERTPEIIELLSSDGGDEPANDCDTNCRTPVLREEEWDRPGPSGDERRRSVREGGSRRAARPRRWSTTSGSSTNCEADTEYSHRRRKKSSSHRGVRRPRTRNYTRNTRSSGPSECYSPLRSRSGTRRKQPSSSPASIDENERHALRRSARDRGQAQRPLCSTAMTVGSSSDSDSDSDSSSSSSSDSSRRSSDERKICAAITVEIRKALKMKKRLEKKSSLSSGTESGESVELSSRRRRRSRRQASIYDSASDNAKSSSMRNRRQPVNATILRKDASNPDEWYVKNNRKTSRGRGRNRSSSSSSFSTSSSSSPQRELRVRGKHKDRREGSSAAGVSGCSRNDEREASTRTKADQPNDGTETDFTCRSNSRCSAISGRTRAKELSKRKEGIKKRKVRSANSESSDSGPSRRAAGASGARRNKRRVEENRTDHDRKKASKGNDGKRNDRERSKEKSGRNEHARKKDEASKSNDHEKRSEHGRKISDQSSKSNGGSRKKEHPRNEDQPGTSKHSDNERRSVSKDKHKRKKKQKTKRRRSRSESKTESRNSRYRMTRSSSYSAPTTNHDDP